MSEPQAQSQIWYRRMKLANDMVQLQNDIDHWNRLHPDEEPIVMSADLAPDIEARKAEQLKCKHDVIVRPYYGVTVCRACRKPLKARTSRG